MPAPKPREPWRSISSKKTVGPVADRLGEDLQPLALVVPVDGDTQPREIAVVGVDLPDALGDVVVVGRRRAQEADAALLQHLHRVDDVRRLHGDVLDTPDP